VLVILIVNALFEVDHDQAHNYDRSGPIFWFTVSVPGCRASDSAAEGG
jgi:hypothetical protein